MSDRRRDEMFEASDDRSFEDVFNRYSSHIQAYCLRRAPLAEARDAAAEVFAIAWRRRRELPYEPSTLPWLYGVAARVLANMRRSHGRRQRLRQRWAGLSHRHQSGPEEVVVEHASNTEVREALRSLSEADREIVMLIAWEELTREQAAIALGCSTEAAKKRYQRAIARLEARLETRAWSWSASRPTMRESDR